MARATQGKQSLCVDSGGWLGRSLARVFRKGRGPDGSKGRDDSGASGGNQERLKELTRAAADGICPDKAADAARSILAGLGVIALVGCAAPSSLPAANYTAEARCVIATLIQALGDSELVDQVIANQITLYEAMTKAGKDPSTVFVVYEALDSCSPVHAPPPAPGGKVL